jgi:hypothetical protein
MEKMKDANDEDKERLRRLLEGQIQGKISILQQEMDEQRLEMESQREVGTLNELRGMNLVEKNVVAFVLINSSITVVFDNISPCDTDFHMLCCKRPDLIFCCVARHFSQTTSQPPPPGIFGTYASRSKI